MVLQEQVLLQQTNLHELWDFSLAGIRCFFIKEWESLCRPLSAGFALVVLRCAGNRCREWRAVCQVHVAFQHTYIKLLCNFGNLIQNTKYQVTGCGMQFTQLLYFRVWFFGPSVGTYFEESCAVFSNRVLVQTSSNWIPCLPSCLSQTVFENLSFWGSIPIVAKLLY